MSRRLKRSVEKKFRNVLRAVRYETPPGSVPDGTVFFNGMLFYRR